MNRAAFRQPTHVWIEWGAFLATLACWAWMAYLTFKNHYLPTPFYYMPDDTWMDWFNTAWWAREAGTYDDWQTVYPPLSFVILKIFGLPQCYTLSGIGETRDCDWLGIVTLHGFFILNIFLTAWTFIRIDRATALPRSFALTAGMPMLFGLERGNLAVLTYTCVLLGFGPLIRSTKLRWLFVGMAVNLKVYLIAGVFAQLLRRRWRWFEGAVIAVVTVYLVSYGLFGSGTPFQIYDNLVNFANGFKPDGVAGVYYTNTYNAMLWVLTDPAMPANYIIGSQLVDIGAVVTLCVLRGTQLIIALGAIATWLRPEVVPRYRVVLFGLAFAMVSSETGTYTAPILFFFAFMESWKGVARPIAIMSCYILCLPGDIPLGFAAALYRFSYLFQHYVISEQYITVGMFVRPLLFSLMPISLAFLTISDVWRDIRFQGWKDRWRFRHDLPLLPGVIRPRPPQPEKGSS